MTSTWHSLYLLGQAEQIKQLESRIRKSSSWAGGEPFSANYESPTKPLLRTTEVDSVEPQNPMRTH
ncbi:uncharacterized protein EI97DRAFT_430343 [Westerdykella ornata]|uniref:Uncharacterized protein n=1 Tax=Westerdykella ornata TaxID=318751 RepID=A0A6A6JS79_WESOR|nr:uncharacterized protein EI97DRAFT_430343 [Westerdykella ornata]KAF2279247.1 hypothetical protein EI97DRAFT_430343 [Westerdykella ornata]